jgi:hypothetical protein
MDGTPDTGGGEDGLALNGSQGGGVGVPASQVGQRREIFWQNVVREILNTLAVAAAQFSGRLTPTAKGAASTGTPDHELFDGRMAVITRLGQRIPIADVYPVFACSVPQSADAEDRMRSADVQCTIFQIRTPTGEVYTLPVHEIASVHALSEALIRRLQAAAQEAAESNGGEVEPFGFAAFTSLARSEQDAAGGEGVGTISGPGLGG